MLNFKKTEEIINKALKPDEKVEHVVKGKTSIKTSAGEEIVDSGIATTNKNRLIVATNPTFEKSKADAYSVELIHDQKLSKEKENISFCTPSGTFELERISGEPDPKKLMDDLGERQKKMKEPSVNISVKNTGTTPIRVNIEPTGR
jgi:hypothetical protein